MTIAFSRSDEAPASEANMSAPIYCVRVPASTSNCGPGFDTLGLAFQLYNEVIVARRDDGAIRYAGDDARFQKQEQAMIEEIAGTFLERSGVEPFGFSFEIRGEVPLARGLGSSVTVRAGVLAGLNAIAGDPLDRRAIAELVTELEGHPDNAVAAVFGGFCVARTCPDTGRLADVTRFDVGSDLLFTVVSPELEIQTRASRQSLPDTLAFPEVVKSLNSLAFVVAVFATGEYEKLRGAVTDFIHQPYRMRGLPGAEAAIAAGVEAGAYTGWLSGSGSTILCAGPASTASAVAKAMSSALRKAGVESRSRLLRCDNDGLRVVRS